MLLKLLAVGGCHDGGNASRHLGFLEREDMQLPHLPKGFFWRIVRGGYNLFLTREVSYVELRRKVGRWSIRIGRWAFYTDRPDSAPFAADLLLEQPRIRHRLGLQPVISAPSIYGDHNGTR